MKKVKLSSLKVGDTFLDKGLTVSGKEVITQCELIGYNGMNKYIVENDGILILQDGDDLVEKK